MFGYVPPGQIDDLSKLKKQFADRMDAYAKDMQSIADSV
jgi:hypothetical protein